MNKLTLLLASFCLVIAGCGDWSKMPSVPREELRAIDTLTLAPATTQPGLGSAALPARITATQPSAPEYRLSIEQARELALTNNLDLRVDLLNPTIAKQNISEEEARFEALFTTDINYAVTDAPSPNRTVSSQSNNLNVTPGVQLPLRTGGVLSFSVPMTRTETGANYEFSTLNPAYTATPEATLNQPLLRGAGAYVAEQPIRVARYGYLQSEAQTKLAIIGVIASVDRAYWRLYAARENLLVRKQEYDLAVAQLDRAKRMVRAGAAAETEVVSR